MANFAKTSAAALWQLFIKRCFAGDGVFRADRLEAPGRRRATDRPRASADHLDLVLVSRGVETSNDDGNENDDEDCQCDS